MVTETPARADRGSAGRIVPLFRPYRLQVAAVIVLIVVTSTIGIINPLLIQVVFNKALFVQGGPKSAPALCAGGRHGPGAGRQRRHRHPADL